MIQTLNFKYYSVEIGRGILNKKLPSGFIITDTNIKELYPNLITQDSFVISAGEKSKSLDTYSQIVQFLEKKDSETIIALGGGVVGDISGFVASTYKRGIDFIQIPTSLLAMVDSSLGGKNGINIGKKKNYLGTIYMPKKIIIDLDFLDTLPEKEFNEGMAEVIKYFFVFGKPNYDLLYGLKKENMGEIISECCRIKTLIAEQDENDKNIRHTLNFGHTIGHAIELLHGLGHGEAISIGMIKEIDLAIEKGLSTKDKKEKLLTLFKKYNLPTELPANFDKFKALEIMKADKKGKFIFAFDEKNYSVSISEEEILNVLQ